MPVRFFPLAGVPDDEAKDVRSVLEKHKIAYYQTPKSEFGINQAAIWLYRDKDLPKASRVLNEYQEERQRQARAEYEEKPSKSIGQAFKANNHSYPFYVVILLVVAILLVSGARHAM